MWICVPASVKMLPLGCIAQLCHPNLQPSQLSPRSQNRSPYRTMDIATKLQWLVPQQGLSGIW
jgi:hypothetical protein